MARARDVLGPDAFGRLYEAVAPRLLAWLRRRVEREVAHDLLAETFARAWVSRRRFDPRRGDGEAWVFGIAHNLVRDYWRRQEVEDRARRRLGLEYELAAVGDDDVEDRLDGEALRGALGRALATLPEAVRAAVLLRVVEQADYAEIGRRLGCSTPNARMRVSRGLRALRDHRDLRVADAHALEVHG